MKLHLPISLRKSVIACILATAGLFPSISISAASWGIAVCLLGTPSAKAEISTVTISSSGKSELISTPDDSLIIMNLNRGYLYGSSTHNSSFDVAADVQIDSLIISDGFKLNTYNFSGDISGSGTFERTSDANGANQTYVFTGDMSQYSGDMKFSREDDGNTFKFIGNQSGTGSISIAAGNTLVVSGATMNNSSITTAGAFNVSGRSHFAGHVTSTGELNLSGSASFAQGGEFSGAFHVSGLSSIDGSVSVNGSLNLAAGARLDNQDTLTMGAGSTLNLAAGAEILNHGTFTFGAGSTLNLAKVAASEDAQRTLTYSVFSAGSTGTSNFSSLSLERIVGIQSVGRNWSFNDDGTLVGVLNNHALSYAGENLTWDTTTATFTNGSETVAFTNGDDVTFSGKSTVTVGAKLQAQRVTVADGAEVALTFQDNASLSVAEAVVNGTLKLQKGGQKGAFSGNVDVYGTLSVETGDVTGWSGTDGIKSIDIFAGGEMYVGVSNNQTGAGLAINLQGGSISGVSGSNFDLGYGGAIYGYSSLSALAADTATAETPTVSTIENCNITLRQYHTTISVAENARLDILSGILVKGNKSDLNGEGSVPSHLQAGLVKTGAGELRLSGNNTYTQATTVAEGTLALTGGASMASSSITVNDGALLHLATESGLSASVSGILSGNGTLRKTGLGSASIGGLADSFAGHIDLQQGMLSVASPVVITSGRELSLGMTGAVLDSSLSLGDGKLSIDYSGSGAATSLNNSALTLLGGTQLQLSSLGNGDGKTYELFTGIGSLLGSDGSALNLDNTNNAISNHFDTTRPGSGFWKEATLQFVDGSLQLVLHEGEVIISADSDGVTRITTWQSNGANYQYYAGLSFKNMPYSSAGGAIYGGRSTPITLSYNGTIEFIENTADGGSALYGSTISLHHNGSVVFRNNSSVSSGAIYVNRYGKLELCDNGRVEFRENTVSSTHGGAIYADTLSSVLISNNGDVTFSGNTASSSSSSAYGGAIYGYNSDITVSNNGSVTFSGNRAESSSYSAYGGAICGYNDSDITVSNNGSVTFSGNTASASSSAYGGAICGYNDSDITLSDNGSVTFIGNRAESSSSSAYGGAIYGDSSSTIELSNNGSVTFSGNSASSSGGAIYTSGNLSVQNNDSVSFYQNAEVNNGSYRLRSIYAGGSGDVISLSAAAEGKNITFRDSIYIASGSTFNLNETYGDREQKGDIIFTGSTTVDDLLAVKGSAGTVEEILNSRTTEVNTMTNLYGGRLRVEDGAIYQGCGITVHEGSAATVLVKNAELQHKGYDLTFHAGTTLELAGNNTISGNVLLQEGSTLLLNAQEILGKSEIFGDLNHSSGVTLSLKNDGYQGYENKILLYVAGDFSDWDTEAFTVTGADNAAVSRVGNFLILNYNAESFNRYYNGEQSYETTQTACLHSHFESICFDGITGGEEGGAISGEETVMLCDNGSLTFHGNTATVKGGAIYGGMADSTVTISRNGSVVFSDNEASSNSSSGGAIYVVNLTMNDNEIVTFNGNSAIHGGAIHLHGNLLVSGNTSVEFSGNAATNGGAIYEVSSSPIILSDNGSITFNGNSATGSGGAIYGSSINLSKNGSVGFEGNVAIRRGGAIAGSSLGTALITINENDSVTFIGNRVESETSGADGGAIYCINNEVNHNKKVSFKDNVASSTVNWAAGGAIRGSASISGNDEVRITGNKAQTGAVSSQGGALFGWEYQLNDNGVLEFFGNSAIAASADGSNAVALGGAIYAFQVYGGTPEYRELSICNNGDTLFQQNSEVRDGVYRLRSIYTEDAGNGAVALSAAAGKSIEFRDSIYVGTGNTISLNADYTDAEEKVHEQKGDIIFTGATTVNDLYKVKGDVDGTDAEILASRTSEINTMSNLYGGRLRVEDGAIYKGRGITVHEDSGATVRVKDAELSHVGYALEFNAGTALEVAGNSTIRGNVNLLADSLFKLEQAATLSLHETLEADAATLTVNGTALLSGSSTLNASLTLAEGATLDMMSLDAGAVTLNGALTFGGQVEMGEHLMSILNEMRGWNESVTLFTGIESLVLPVTASSEASSRVWVGDVFSNMAGNENYYFNYVPDVGSLMVVHVPEPTTTTLSLLALAGLAARRRRR